jgi:hypothetical protein
MACLLSLVTQTYPKPWKSYQEQLDQLIARGVTVTDNARHWITWSASAITG